MVQKIMLADYVVFGRCNKVGALVDERMKNGLNLLAAVNDVVDTYGSLDNLAMELKKAA